MDYAHEELLRQRRALMRLLLGGGETEDERERREAENASPAAGDETQSAGAEVVPAGRAAKALSPLEAEPPAPPEMNAVRRTRPLSRSLPAPPGGQAAKAPSPEAGIVPAEEEWVRQDLWPGTAVFRRYAPVPGGGEADGSGESSPAEVPSPPKGGRGAASRVVLEAAGTTAEASPGGAAWRYREAEGLFARTASGEAEALSRTYQRDARRYDGGFTLY